MLLGVFLWVEGGGQEEGGGGEGGVGRIEMRSCFVGSLLGLEVGGRTRTLGTCRRARRSGSVVACVSEEGKVEGGPPKVRRDIGLHQSWYIYYEVRWLFC